MCINSSVYLSIYITVYLSIYQIFLIFIYLFIFYTAPMDDSSLLKYTYFLLRSSFRYWLYWTIDDIFFLTFSCFKKIILSVLCIIITKTFYVYTLSISDPDRWSFLFFDYFVFWLVFFVFVHYRICLFLVQIDPSHRASVFVAEFGDSALDNGRVWTCFKGIMVHLCILYLQGYQSNMAVFLWHLHKVRISLLYGHLVKTAMFIWSPYV